MKKIALLLALITVFSVVLCSCGAGEKILYPEMTKDQIAKYLKAGSYDNLKYTISYDIFADAETEVKELIASAKRITGAVKDGDTVNIDYVGYFANKNGTKGEAFEGGTANKYDLEIGSGAFIPGFEDGLIGKEIGKVHEIPLTFPEDYKNEMAGKDVIFRVTIHSATPPFNTEFVKENTDYETIPEYIDSLVVKYANNYVKEQKAALLKSKTEVQTLTAEDKIQNGDRIVINMTIGESAKNEGYEFVLNDGSLKDIDQYFADAKGFNEGILANGKIGETVEFDITYSDTYRVVELRGTTAKAVVEIVSGKRDLVPEYTDAFVKENKKVETIAIWEESLYNEYTQKVENEMEEAENKAAREELGDLVLKAFDVKKYPKANVKAYYEQLYTNYEYTAQNYGVTLQNYISLYLGIPTIEQFEKTMDTSAKEQVKKELLSYYIAYTESIDISQTVIDAKLLEIAKANGCKTAEEYFNKGYDKTITTYGVVYDLVIDWLLENSERSYKA